MSEELIIHTNPVGVEVAILENNNLVEFHKEHVESKFNVGDIFLVRVKKVVPSLNAAFIGIGYKKDGFLHYSDLGPQLSSLKKFVNQSQNGQTVSAMLNQFKLESEIIKTGKINEVLHRNTKLLVQVVKEPIASKGPRLTSDIGMPGRMLVLTPFTDHVAVSKKINDTKERNRLKRLISSIKPENFGVIIRTNAVKKGVADLHNELNQLIDQWKELVGNLKTANTPQRVFSDAKLTASLLRDYMHKDTSKIVVDDKHMHENIDQYLKKIAPEKQKTLQLYTGEKPIFSKYDVTKQIKSAFGRVVKMKSGAYLVIEHTEALHVIDVNSGKRVKTGITQEDSAFQINMEAAEKIARQLRLRDIGGIIVVDFIDMKDVAHKRKIHQTVKEAMANDRSRHVVLPISRFGLLQITRQRSKPEVKIQTTETCPTCRGTGETASTLLLTDEIENGIRIITEKTNPKRLTVLAHPIIAAFLVRGIPSLKLKWSWQYKCWIKVVADENLPITKVNFYDKNREEIEW